MHQILFFLDIRAYPKAGYRISGEISDAGNGYLARNRIPDIRRDFVYRISGERSATGYPARYRI
jgi:hypothetical protein